MNQSKSIFKYLLIILISLLINQLNNFGFLVLLLFKEYIDPQHAEAFENLRKAMKTPSRVRLLICHLFC